MSASDIKVGDVVAWANVEDGMMVSNGRYRAVRIGGRGTVVYEEFGVSGRSRSEADRWTTWAGSWPWPRLSSDSAKVIVEAVGLTGGETADELRRLAEAFDEVRPT